MTRLLLSLLLCLSFAFAQESSNRQREIEGELAKYENLRQERDNELQAIEQELGETATALNDQITRRDDISQDLALLKSERNDLESSISELSGSLEDTQNTISDLQDQIAKLKTRVEGILINLYKQRNGSYANVVSQAKTFHELQIKTEYLSLLAERDVELIQELNTKAQLLAVLQEEQTTQIADLNSQSEALSQNEASLVNTQSELDSVIDTLESTQKGNLALRAALLKEQAELETSIVDALAALEAEKERLRQEAEAKRQQAEAANTETERQELIAEAEQAETRLAALGAPLPALNSDYIYPISSPTLIRSYGDFGSSVVLSTEQAGAAVVAIQKGVVRLVTFVSANDGYLVSLQHGESFGSTYLNLQERSLVSVGDVVEQGQVLGYLGGGSLTPPNVLKFYTQITNPDGSVATFTDPAQELGF